MGIRYSNVKITYSDHQKPNTKCLKHENCYPRNATTSCSKRIYWSCVFIVYLHDPVVRTMNLHMVFHNLL